MKAADAAPAAAVDDVLTGALCDAVRAEGRRAVDAAIARERKSADAALANARDLAAADLAMALAARDVAHVDALDATTLPPPSSDDAELLSLRLERDDARRERDDLVRATPRGKGRC